MRFHVQKARLEEISGEKIRSESQHARLWKEYYRELTPGFEPQAGLARRRQLEKAGKGRTYDARFGEAVSKGRIILSWCYPNNNDAIVASCDVCPQLTFGYGNPTQFHDSPCYDSVQRGAEIFPKEGTPSKNENQKRAFCWAVRRLLGGEEFSVIADGPPHQDRMFVKREIKRILPLVPHPDKVARGFKKIVSMVREEAAKRNLLGAASKI
jgi:hypothetical protein